MGRISRWGYRIRRFETDVYALYLACRDPRVPWYAKAFAGAVVAYAFSPIDLIPDPIPVVGYLDDMVLIPLGMKVAGRMIPRPVLDECRHRAEAMVERRRPVFRWAVAVAVFCILFWLAAIAAIIWLILR